MIALHALIHSLHVIKMILRFLWSQWYVRFPNRGNWTIGSKDIARLGSHGPYALCQGRVGHTRLI